MKTRAAEALERAGIRFEIREFQTGYIRGGASPLGGKKAYPVYLDQSALAFQRIGVSAGMRGMELLLAPQDLVRATRATVAPLGEEKGR